MDVTGGGQQRRPQIIFEARERLFQDGAELLQLDAVVVQVTLQRPLVVRGEGGDLAVHVFQVAAAIQLPAGTERQPVLRRQPLHRDFGHQVSTDRRVDLVQHPGIEEERRPAIEPKAVLLDRTGPAPDAVGFLQQRDVHPGMGQLHRRGQPAGTGTNDDNARGRQRTGVGGRSERPRKFRRRGIVARRSAA